MDEPAIDEPVTVETDGVVVTKSFLPEELAVPAVRVCIESNRETKCTVIVTEKIPDSTSVEDIAFHPEYDKTGWTTNDAQHQIEYRTEVGSEETAETVYGLRIDDIEEATAFLNAPTLTIEETDGTNTTDMPSVDAIAPVETTRSAKQLLTDNTELAGTREPGDHSSETPFVDQLLQELESDTISESKKHRLQQALEIE